MIRLKAIHIDDEMDSIEVLQLLIAKYCPQIELVGYANTVDDGIKLIEDKNPHVVFLDVEMPGKNGFELLETIPNKKFQTIMVTGYENYAIKAIKYSALDYLLKPLDVEDLQAAVARLQPNFNIEDPRLAHYNTNRKQTIADRDNLMIASTTGFKNLSLNEIVYIRSETGNYSIFYTENGEKELASKPLTHFENLLPKHLFFRIHRSHMVNLSKIKTVDTSNNLLVLSNGVELTISARKKVDLRKLLSK